MGLHKILNGTQYARTEIGDQISTNFAPIGPILNLQSPIPGLTRGITYE